ncbi:hypothetical protein P154DRAFT_206312 [Amniculicola lignicola CBS 123094]|uniref:Uncharacterized protein n=1 Tax=Amniculicola lignicola CBS 123094 TaxID=1392246 RepID=A0A6A5WDR0_9PLEO|nr:hypothetical protein P154DRAFT_206312 [Amniculicola lignicola CBS 123094]
MLLWCAPAAATSATLLRHVDSTQESWKCAGTPRGTARPGRLSENYAGPIKEPFAKKQEAGTPISPHVGYINLRWTQCIVRAWYRPMYSEVLPCHHAVPTWNLHTRITDMPLDKHLMKVILEQCQRICLETVFQSQEEARNLMRTMWRPPNMPYVKQKSVCDPC